MGEVEVFYEPSRFSLPPMGYCYPILGAANGREDGDGEHRLQGVPRGGVLTTWVMDNREKSQNLLDPSGVGHSVIPPKTSWGAMRLFRQRTRYHTPTAHKLVDAIALGTGANIWGVCYV